MDTSLKQLFLKLISDIDDQILQVGSSQSELEDEINRLINTLDSIKMDDGLAKEISSSSKRIVSLKSRITMCHNILSNTSDRCNRILAAASNIVPQEE